MCITRYGTFITEELIDLAAALATAKATAVSASSSLTTAGRNYHYNYIRARTPTFSIKQWQDRLFKPIEDLHSYLGKTQTRVVLPGAYQYIDIISCWITSAVHVINQICQEYRDTLQHLREQAELCKSSILQNRKRMAEDFPGTKEGYAKWKQIKEEVKRHSTWIKGAQLEAESSVEAINQLNRTATALSTAHESLYSDTCCRWARLAGWASELSAQQAYGCYIRDRCGPNATRLKTILGIEPATGKNTKVTFEESEKAIPEGDATGAITKDSTAYKLGYYPWASWNQLWEKYPLPGTTSDPRELANDKSGADSAKPKSKSKKSKSKSKKAKSKAAKSKEASERQPKTDSSASQSSGQAGDAVVAEATTDVDEDGLRPIPFRTNYPDGTYHRYDPRYPNGFYAVHEDPVQPSWTCGQSALDAQASRTELYERHYSDDFTYRYKQSRDKWTGPPALLKHAKDSSTGHAIIVPPGELPAGTDAAVEVTGRTDECKRKKKGKGATVEAKAKGESDNTTSTSTATSGSEISNSTGRADSQTPRISRSNSGSDGSDKSAEGESAIGNSRLIPGLSYSARLSGKTSGASASKEEAVHGKSKESQAVTTESGVDDASGIHNRGTSDQSRSEGPGTC